MNAHGRTDFNDMDIDQSIPNQPAVDLLSSSSLLAALPDAVLIVSADGIVEFANPAATELFGRDTSELVGAAIGLQFSGQNPTEHIHVNRPDGSTRDVEFRSVLLAAADGSTIVNLRDVTERNLLQSRLRQGEKMEAVGRLAGGIAHDFNNLLAAILGYGELVERKLELADGERIACALLQDDIAEIRRAAKSAKGLTGQLLNFSSRHRPPRSSCDLSTVLNQHRRIYEAACGGILRLIVEVGANVPRIALGAEVIDQIILNLAVNARDAVVEQRSRSSRGESRYSSELLITATSTRPPDDPDAYTSQCESWVELRVVDHGPGVPSEVRAHIFEPFFTTKGDGLGCGFGLSTVYGLVSRNGGKVELHDTPGGGATFVILLPCSHQGEDLEPCDPQDDAPEVEQDEILLVDDDKALRFMFERVLSDEGYRVRPMGDGAEAIQYLEKCADDLTRGPSLLLTDVAMPGISGIEVTQQARKLFPNLPIIMMSGYTSGSLRHRFGEAHVDPGDAQDNYRFLQKPFEFDDLIRAVDETLEAVRAAK